MQSIKPISVIFIVTLLGATCTFFTGVVLANELGDENFGVFFSSLSLITIAATLGSFGTPGFLLKIFGKEGWDATRWVARTIRTLIATSAAVSLLVLIWAMFGPNDKTEQYIFIVLLTCIFSQIVLAVVSSKFQLEECFYSLAIWEFVQPAARFLLVGILVLLLGNKADAFVIACAYASVGIAITCFGWRQLAKMNTSTFLLKGHGQAPLKFNQETVQPKYSEIIYQVWPFALGAISYVVYYQSDVIFLRYLASKEEAGTYSTAFMVIAIVCMLPNIIYQKFMLPKIHRWAHKDKLKLYEFNKKGNRVMLLSGSILMIGMWLIVPKVFPIFFNKEYDDAVLIIQILLLVLPARFLAISVGAILTTRENMRLKSKYMGLVAVLNILLNIPLIIRFGMVGAASATVFCEFSLLALYLYGSKKIKITDANL